MIFCPLSKEYTFCEPYFIILIITEQQCVWKNIGMTIYNIGKK